MIQYLYRLQNDYYNKLVIRTFKIYSLSNFQICKTVLLARSLRLLAPFTHLTTPARPLAASGNRQSVFCVFEGFVWFFRFHT